MGLEIGTIAAIVGALGSLGSGAASLSGALGSHKQAAPTPAPAPLPPGPAPDLTKDQLTAKKGEGDLTAPNFLQFGSGMTNLQKRSQIATYGLQGNDSKYSDPASVDFWKKSLLNDYGTPGFNILPVERQFAESKLGASPRNGSDESFLSALLRG